MLDTQKVDAEFRKGLMYVSVEQVVEVQSSSIGIEE